MPGLCGIISRTEDLQRSLKVFRRVHAINGVQFSEAFYESDEALIANFMLDWLEGSRVQPGRITGSRSALMLEGEIYNSSELSRKRSSADSAICHTLLKMYLDSGPDFVKQLDGEFNIVIYEADSRKLTILTDHIASYPLYFYEHSNGFLFGSEKKALLAIAHEGRDVDPVGLLQLVMHQHNLQDRTYMKGIKRLRPASKLTVEGGRVTVSTYDEIVLDQQNRVNANDLLEEWRDKLEVATAKRIRNKNRLLFSLSAGLDSRAVACAIDRNSRPILARTAGIADSYEVRYAKEIAARLGFGHFIENPADHMYSDGVHKIVWRTEGEIQFRHAVSIFTHSVMKSYGDHFIGGWLGDVSSGAHLRPFIFLPINRGDFVDTVFERYLLHKEAELRSIFNPEFLAEHLPAVKEAFHESFDPYKDVSNPRAYELWDLYNRQTRMIISSMPVDSHLFGKVRPFFDRSYLKFAMSIPLRFRVGQSLYKSMIYRMGPEIRSVPNANTNTRLRAMPIANFADFLWSSTMLVTGKAIKRVRPEFKRPIELKSPLNLASITRNDYGLHQIVLDFVNSSNFDSHIFDRAGILHALKRHYNGQADLSVLICILVTFSVALPYFVYEKVERCPAEAEPLGNLGVRQPSADRV